MQKKELNVLVLGSGGREHALIWKLSQSTRCNKLYAAPGNPGTAQLATNLILDISNFSSLREEIVEHQIGLLLIGPEQPLVEGLRDYLEAHLPASFPLQIIGPGKAGAQLEGSKSFAKKFMLRHGIPTAAYLECTHENITEGENFLRQLQGPYVIKADGLAAGKGVVIEQSFEAALSTLHSMLIGKFGSAGKTVVIEEFLSGVECSVFVLKHQKHYVLLPSAKDYKRIGEGDTGLNTGGMGAVSPVPFFEGVFKDKVLKQVVIPTIEGLLSEGIDYDGFIFFGLINVKGDPFVIEYNCRLGDPETEAIMPMIQDDLLDILMHSEGGLPVEVKLNNGYCTAVVLAAGGYPEQPEKGKILALDQNAQGVLFHAGTSLQEGKLLTSGGRVMNAVGQGKTIEEARKRAMLLAESIRYENKYFRKDIGKDLEDWNQ